MASTTYVFFIDSNIMEKSGEVRLKVFNLAELYHKAIRDQGDFTVWALQNYSDP